MDLQRLHVTAKSRDATGNGWGYLLEFTDGDGVAKRWAMPSSMLSGDGTQYRAVLLSMGLRIGTGTAAKNHLSSYARHAGAMAPGSGGALPG